MPDFYLSVGDSVEFSKTVSETDVYLFAGITGDFAPIHVNAEVMSKSAYGQRLAHGALLIGFMSTTSTMMVACAKEMPGLNETPVALGYDRIRFIRPVFFGDTITVRYRIDEVDVEKRRTKASIEVTNQRAEQICVATGLLKWVTRKE
ncbi:MaoC family dehydratase [Caballeronia sp. LjRoot34]|uniref:MaoC family dehydratase n=1 Tax=Caballeronia sp. LjRoot34 TaxID=3342325 RepID=UPI003ED05E81